MTEAGEIAKSLRNRWFASVLPTVKRHRRHVMYVVLPMFLVMAVLVGVDGNQQQADHSQSAGSPDVLLGVTAGVVSAVGYVGVLYGPIHRRFFVGDAQGAAGRSKGSKSDG